jgi:hypothetical protein
VLVHSVSVFGVSEVAIRWEILVALEETKLYKTLISYCFSRPTGVKMLD